MYHFRRLVAAATAIILVSNTLPVLAQQAPSGSGISISPTTSDFTIARGQAQKLDITLKNITVGNITAQAYINDFTSDNSTGSPRIITDPNKKLLTSIRDFVIGLDDVPLKKGEQKKLSLALQMPANVSPGAYYGIIRFKAVPAGENAPESGEVALSASVGTIVFITVPGTIKEQVQLTALHVYNGKHEGTFFFRKPTDIGVEVRNLGNGLAKPFGTIELQDMFGKSAYNYQLNSTTPRGNVLPGSSRIFINQTKNISKPGRYTVMASVAYGSGSEVLVLDKTFWYIPGWLMVVILAVLAFLALTAYWSYRHHRLSLKRPHRRKG
ncbi:hypothetical protein COU91_01815 [Candidatus Saccharibacteria bacterium CG10_big_fil_rev_8_21_14_0_10_47_8]|nr:MAG: hypothetical protein COU91_01815 [Candidatus Saccharibacteria bacterium CG10_big_fil_rev_8_21_14_0_10_47_8]